MVYRTKYGLGPPELAVSEFEKLCPHVETMIGLRAECGWMTADGNAWGIALDGIETAADHFTRRRHFYDRLASDANRIGTSNGRLRDRAEAIEAFYSLAPYMQALRRLQGECKPFGRDYLALNIPMQCLQSTVYHFVQIDGFYGARGDGSGRGAERWT